MQPSPKELELFISSGEALSKRWEPHETQRQVIRALFFERKKLIVVECGRQWGKTELLCCIGWWWGRIKPGSQSVYFAPWLSQARDILWTPRRVQHFGPPEWVRDVSETYMRIDWSNSEDGFFRLAGTNDDPDKSARGIYFKDGLLIYDEARDIKEEFFDIADPITARFDAPILIFTSPPETETIEGKDQLTKYCQLARQAKERPDGAFFNFATSDNPYIPAEWLARKKEELYAENQGWLWEREYEGKRVSAAASGMFPMLSRSRHCLEYGALLPQIKQMGRKLSYWAMFDPGNRAAFGALFIAWDQRTNDVWFLDEIYERDQMKNTADGIWQEAKGKMLQIFPDLTEWILYYDEAALWFANEVRAIQKRENVVLALRPTNKALHKREDREPRPGISIAKQMLLRDLAHFSEACGYLLWEMEHYRLDREGRLTKKNDHLIDLMHYFINESGYMPGVIDVTRWTRVDSSEVYDVKRGRFEDRLIKRLDKSSEERVAEVLDDPYYRWHE